MLAFYICSKIYTEYDNTSFCNDITSAGNASCVVAILYAYVWQEFGS